LSVVRVLAERACFGLCRAFGQLLRSARYAAVRVVDRDGTQEVHKHRFVHAPLLIRLSEPLATLLDTGVRVLRQNDWEQREQRIYRTLYDVSVRSNGAGVLVLPHLHGDTLAALLEDPTLEHSVRYHAIALAAAALADLHRRGFTHGDAMAENVMVDLDAGVACWFDFETLHDPRRSTEWCRADDVRALLVTSLLRTRADAFADTLRLVLDVYADERVTRFLAGRFTPVLQRPLSFHLGQAPLSLRYYQEIARLLRQRLGE
jgi:tRNA A-37 threonylcarbamoyl transferase component Bud32